MTQSQKAAIPKKLLPGGPPIICPNANCGYRGPGLVVKSGSPFLAGLMVVFLFIIPGLIYWYCCCTEELRCPQCSASIRMRRCR